MDVSPAELDELITTYLKMAADADANAGAKDEMLEQLDDQDLQNLLENFQTLDDDEQTQLIEYLRRMEVADPERVEKLRKFVNWGADDN